MSKAFRVEIDSLGHSRAPVLLLGESGSGKEVIARAIWEVERSGELLIVDCGALVGALVESELFGHVRGAFTGADRDKLGLVARADGGKLFLGEIGDLALELQVKLLRLLQEKTYRPLGSLAPKKADFRVIAATHRPLEQHVAEGKFRQDLFYRLNVLTFCVPPLRERREDIPALIDFFLAREKLTDCALSQAVLQALVDYHWPGNVRELSNVIARMAARADRSSGLLTLAALPPEVAQSKMWHSAQAYQQWNEAESPAVKTLAEVERAAIIQALGSNKGDRQRTADQLGISRATLFRKLREFGVQELSSA